MTQIKTTIDALKAVAPFMSKEQTRHYINGVLVQGNLLVATDGHRLAVIKSQHWELEGEQAEDFILPRNVIEQVLKTKLAKRARGCFIIDTTAKTITVLEDNEPVATYNYEPVDGTFPDWNRVIPDAHNYEIGAPASFNPSLLSAFEAFGPSITVFLNKDVKSPAFIRGGVMDAFEAVGVVMPTYKGPQSTADIFPAWFRPGQQKTEVK